MNKYLFLCIKCCLIVTVLSDLKTILEQGPCSKNDNKCFTEFTILMFDTLVSGDEEIGMKSIEPSLIEKIDGDLPIVKYTLRNSTLRGFSTCQFQKASITEDEQGINLNILCKKLNMCGKYEVNGTLIVLPVRGDGDYCIEARTYKLVVQSEILKYEGEDGKDYVKFGTYKYDAELQGGFDFNITNMFGGNRDLSEPFFRFARRHWKIVTRQIQEPPITATVKMLIDKFNSLIKYISLDRMVKD